MLWSHLASTEYDRGRGNSLVGKRHNWEVKKSFSVTIYYVDIYEEGRENYGNIRMAVATDEIRTQNLSSI